MRCPCFRRWVRAHTRCWFLLFIVLTINDRSNGRISAAWDNRIRRWSLQRLSPISIP